VTHPFDFGGQAGLLDPTIRGLEGPVVEERAAYDVFARDEAPEAGVGGVVAVVTHHEVLAGRDDEIAVDDVRVDFGGPLLGFVVAGLGDYGVGGKLVFEWQIGGIGAGGVAVGFREGLWDAVDVDHAIVEMDVVAGDADEALDEGLILRLVVAGHGVSDWLEEDYDVAAPGLTVANEREPVMAGREGEAIDEEVIADEEGVLHGAGGDDEVLADEIEDEETDYEDPRVAGNGFEEGFSGFVPGCGDDVCGGGFRHSWLWSKCG